MKFKVIAVMVVSFSLCVDFVLPQSHEDSPEERRAGGNRRRPCVFRTKPKKGHHQGRTFLDWNFQHYDISYNYNYNIDCSGGSGGGSNNHPGLIGSHFQPGLLGSHFQGSQNHQPGLLGSHFQGGSLFGSHNQPGGGGLLGSLFNRPQSQGGLINNIPGIPQIGNGISQSQSQTQADAYNSGGRPGRPRPGIYYNQNSYYNKLSQYSVNRGY